MRTDRGMIAFISLVEDVSVPSLRYLSSYLRANGHDTALILLPWRFTDQTLNSSNSFLYPYPPRVLRQIENLTSDATLVGISMMTCHFDNAVYITKFLHQQIDAPVIWGGIHPTIRPLECLKYADMVCVGEGEVSLRHLASEMRDGKSWDNLRILGIYKRGDNGPFLPSPIIQDLNELPLPDYELNNHFILYKGNLVQLNADLLVKCLNYSYRTLFSRGCPYACTYCCNNVLRQIYNRKLPLRWRNVDNQIKELKKALEIMPKLKEVVLGDDSFLSLPNEVIEDFATRYRKEIGLPLGALAVPRAVSEFKLRQLIKAGLYDFGIGIQSGSKRTRDLYRRLDSLDDIIKASRRIKRISSEMNKRVTVRYDLILDNPWEKKEDIEDSIRFCMKLEKPLYLALFSLTFYPGTELYMKARNEDIVSDDLNQVYRRSQLTPRRTFLNGIFECLSAHAPNAVINFLLSRYLRNCRSKLTWLPYLLASIFRPVKHANEIILHVAKGDWPLIKIWLIAESLNFRQNQFSYMRASTQRLRFHGAPGRARYSC